MDASSLASNVSAELSALASSYLQPWRSGVTLDAVNDAHVHWADYRDAQWGGYVPPGVSRNRLLRVNVLGGELHYVGCAGSTSTRRLERQRSALALLQSVLETHAIPDLDLVLSISDRPTVPRSLVPSGSAPPPVFAYATTPWHHSVPFPPVSFEPRRWASLQAQRGAHPPLVSRAPTALWRGSCNSLCDMMPKSRHCSLPRDALLLPRQVLLQAASRCADLVDVGVTSAHRNCAGAVPRRPVSMSGHARHAILLHVDGNGFSGRLDELLTLGGVVLKQDSPFSAYYYPLLRRGLHYVPLRRNLTDLCEAAQRIAEDLRAARRRRRGGGGADGGRGAGDSRAVALAAAGVDFASRYLTPEAVRTYLASLLTQYASLQRFQPVRHPDAVRWRDGVRPAAQAAAAAAPAAAAREEGGGGSSAPPLACSDAACCRRHPKACTAGWGGRRKPAGRGG